MNTPWYAKLSKEHDILLLKAFSCLINIIVLQIKHNP